MLLELQLHLRDISPPVVEAWTKAFAGFDKVKVSLGDILECEADALVSPANSFGFMDGGIDAAYSLHFGWSLGDRLRKHLRDAYFGELLVGQAAIIPISDMPFSTTKPTWLISAPTMRIPGRLPPDTVNAFLALRGVLFAVARHNRATPDSPILSVLCPGLGTAVGAVAPERCAKQMVKAYEVGALGHPWAEGNSAEVLEAQFHLQS